jgi:O-antigen/teichoic acid export membrane protein
MTWPQKLALNTLYNFFGRFTHIIVNIILTPLLLNKLGVEKFGVWSLLFTVAGYFFLIDFGFETFTKYTAEYHIRKMSSEINKIVNTGIALYGALLLIVIAILFVFNSSILNLLHIPAKMYEETRTAMFIVVLSLGFSYLFIPFRGVLLGLQRMDIANLMLIISAATTGLGTGFVLKFGYELVGLAYVHLLSTTVIILGNIIFCSLLITDLKIHPKYISREAINIILKYGGKIQISNIAAIINFASDKLMIALFLSTAYITTYELGFRVVYIVIIISQILVSAMMPMVSSMKATNDIKALDNMYFRISKYHALIMFALCTFLITCAPTLLLVWLGNLHPDSVLVIRLLTVAYLAKTLTDVPIQFVRGLGLPEFEMWLSIARGTTYVLLATILIQIYGFHGLLLTAPLILVTSSSYFLVTIHKKLSLSILTSLQQIYGPFLIWSVIAGVITYVIQSLWISNISTSALGLLFMFFMFILFSAVLGAGLVASNYIKIEEIRLIVNLCLNKFKEQS